MPLLALAVAAALTAHRFTPALGPEHADTACQVLHPERVPAAGRKSPLDSLTFTVAGIKVPAGAYSLYTVPGAAEWEIVVNRSITQWGEESNYTPAIQAQEVGRAKVRSETLAEPIAQPERRRTPSTKRSTSSAVV